MAERQTQPPDTARKVSPNWRLAGLLILAWAGLLIVGFAIGSILTAAPPSLDASTVDTLRGARTGALTTAMRAITWLGSPVVLDFVFAATLAVLLVKRARRKVLFLALASPGTVLMIQITKAVVARPRPPGLHLTAAEGLSWPSGHASSSAALYGALLLLILDTGALSTPRARLAAKLLVATILVLIGISRVYLGVHYPSDVIGAWLLTAGWLIVLARTIGRSPRRDPEPAVERRPAPQAVRRASRTD